MTATYTFSSREQQRLATYRAAVGAGFYSEFPRRSHRTDARLLQRLLHASPSVPDYPFSEAELQRLTACRAAVEHGYFSG